MSQSLGTGRGALALGTCAFLVSNPAAAQEPAEGERTAQRDSLQEVVVTARYREESLQDTPIAITAITAEDLEVRGFTSAAEVGYSVPNASFRPTGGAYGNTMSAYIRGIGQNDFNFAFEPGVGVYVDDIYYPTTMGSMIDLLDLERVEVLRGPQGTLFGRGSIGGALRFVTKQPRGDDSGFITATVGRFDRVDVRAGYDVALIEDTLFARVTGMAKRRDGWQTRLDFACVNPVAAGVGDGLASGGGITVGPGGTPIINPPVAVTPGSPEDLAFAIPRVSTNRFADCELGTLGGEDVTGARAAVRWLASERVELTVTADYQNDDSEARANSLLRVNVIPGSSYDRWSQAMVALFGVPFDSRFVTGDPSFNYATFTDPLSGLSFTPLTALEQQGVAAVLDWNLADTVGAKLILGYREFESRFAYDHDSSPLNEQLVDGRQTFDSRTAELRFSGRAMERLDWTVGAFYYDGDATSGQSVSLPSANNPVLNNYLLNPQLFPLLVNGRDVSEFGNESAYAHAVYELTDTIRFTAGARYSSDDKASDFDNTIVQATLDSSESRFDYRVGVDFQFSESQMLYASTATGYRPPAFNPRPFQPSQFRPVDGEELTAYEVGLKSDFFDRRLRMNTALFFSDYEQRIVPQGGVECLKDPAGNLIPGPVTNPEGGPSCAGTLPLTRYVNAPGEIAGIELEFALRPTDALTIGGNGGWIDWSSDDLDDNPAVVNDLPVFVPEWNASLNAQYEFLLPNGGSLVPRVDVYFQAEICTSNFTLTSCSPGYELTNARVEYADPERAWTLALGVTNATDEEYLLNIFDLSAFGQPTTEGQFGRPREWYLSFTRTFD